MPNVRASSGMIGTMRRPISGSRTRFRTSRLKAMVVLAGRSEPAKNSVNASSFGAGSGFGVTCRRGVAPPSCGPSLEHVLDLGRIGSGVVVRRLLELVVGDRQLQAVAEDLQLVGGELLGLVGDVAALDARAERPALHRLGQDHRRRALVLHGRCVGGVDLAVVVAAASELAQIVVAQVLDERAQSRIGTEEVLADVGAVADGQALVVAVERLVHLVEQDAVLVAGQEVIPLACPDDLDHVPAGAAEDGLQLLDDLAVAAHRAVEALEVAVDDEREVVEPLASGERQRPDRLRLVHLAVAQEGPDASGRGVGDAARGKVAVEARLVDGGHRARGPCSRSGTARSRA